MLAHLPEAAAYPVEAPHEPETRQPESTPDVSDPTEGPADGLSALIQRLEADVAALKQKFPASKTLSGYDSRLSTSYSSAPRPE